MSGKHPECTAAMRNTADRLTPLKDVDQAVEWQGTGPFAGKSTAGNIADIQLEKCRGMHQRYIAVRTHCRSPVFIKIYLFC